MSYAKTRLKLFRFWEALPEDQRDRFFVVHPCTPMVSETDLGKSNVWSLLFRSEAFDRETGIIDPATDWM